MTTSLRIVVPALCSALAISASVPAQQYPSRPIRFIAAFPAGGPSDIVTRALGKRMSKLLGQAVVVENRGGAGGHIGAEHVARSPADGYTLLLGGSYLTIGPSLYRKLAYDTVRDFAPIGLVAINQYLLVSHPSVPASNVRDLIALARRNSGKLNYGSSGLGAPPHLAGELLKTMAKVDLVHVPYKGATPALIDLYFGGISGAMPHAKTGKIRALAVTGLKRSPQMPAVPTIAEAALPGYDITTWFGLVTAANTPRAIVDRLNSVVQRVVGEAETREYLVAQGLETATSTPEEFAAFIKGEIPKFAAIAKAAGLKPE